MIYGHVADEEDNQNIYNDHVVAQSTPLTTGTYIMTTLSPGL
jgi:hypothetical protein